ncbi:MAG: phosphatase PAP2 family protein [Rhodothermales bacterium]
MAPPRPLLLPLLLAVSLFVSLVAPAAHAQQTDGGRFLRWATDDPLGVLRGLTSRHAIYTAGAGSALVLFTLTDDTLTGSAGEERDQDLGPFLNTTNLIGDPNLALPAAAVVFGATLLTEDARLQDAAFTSLEAGLYGHVLASVLKGFAGRARPHRLEGPYDFEPFSDQKSFPSGHTTLAFALITPWVVYYPSPATYALFGVTTGTAVARVVGGDHWSSDVVAGAAIGILTGYALANRHQRHPSGLRVSPTVTQGGAGLSLRLSF